MGILKSTMATAWTAYALLAATACDDGHVDDPVYADNTATQVACVVGTFRGLEAWGENYQLALACFGAGSDYSIVQKNFPPRKGTTTRDTLTLAGVPTSAQSVEVAVCNALRRRIATLYSMPAPESGGDTLLFDLGDADLSPFGAVDKAIFQRLSCNSCHGGDAPAAGLDLTTGRAHASLVGTASTRKPGELLVAPGDTARSFLYRVLTTGDESVRYSHPVFFVEDDRVPLLELVAEWIRTTDE